MLKFEEYRPNRFTVKNQFDEHLGLIVKYDYGIEFDLGDFSLSESDIDQIKEFMEGLNK